MLLKELNQSIKETNFQQFYNDLSIILPGLKNFTESKIRLAESENKIGKGFYNVNDILDEVYLDVFENFKAFKDEKELRQVLFVKIIQKIDEKVGNEEALKGELNIDTILKEELDGLKESYTIQADGDIILKEDLDDISYKQDANKQQSYLLDESLMQQFKETLNLSHFEVSNTSQTEVFNKLFFKVPYISRTIIELHVFGHQSFTQISEILTVDESNIKQTFSQMRTFFKAVKNL